MINLDQVNWTSISYQELELMLRLCEHVNSELSNHLTPLCSACKYNREDLVTVLLHHGAQANRPCSFYNKQPLHFACNHSAGNLGVVRKLLQAEANIDALDLDGNTGLHIACTESNIGVVELLVQSGADVNLADVDGETPLIRACFAQNIELMDILLKMGSDPNALGGQAVAIAVLNSSVGALKLLLDSGAGIHQGNFLIQACEHNHIEMMKVLNSYGIDVNKCDRLGRTALHAACLSHQASDACVRLLLEWGAQPNSRTTMGDTALYCAIITRSLEKVRLLLAFGADVNANTIHFLPHMLKCLTKSYDFDPCHQILRLVLAAGIRLSLQDLHFIKNTASNLPSSDGKADFISLVDVHISHPLSLQSLCRISIRSSVKSVIDVNMKTLPLPSHLIRVLNFCDIVNEPL